jgi:hypothetical protein
MKKSVTCGPVIQPLVAEVTLAEPLPDALPAAAPIVPSPVIALWLSLRLSLVALAPSPTALPAALAPEPLVPGPLTSARVSVPELVATFDLIRVGGGWLGMVGARDSVSGACTEIGARLATGLLPKSRTLDW